MPDLNDYKNKLIRMQQDAKEAYERCGAEMGARYQRLVKQRTPVGTKPGWAFERAVRDSGGDLEKFEELSRIWNGYSGGELRRSWIVDDAVWKSGTCYVSVRNTKKYASFVEVGHRQTPGRYVKQLGVRLKKPWIEGKHMMLKSEEEFDPKIKDFVSRWFDEWAKQYGF